MKFNKKYQKILGTILNDENYKNFSSTFVYNVISSSLQDKNYVPVDVYGAGINGIVFKLQHRTKKTFRSVKVVTADNEKVIIHEAKMQKILAQYNMAPSVHEIYKTTYRSTPLMFTVMDPITTTLYKYLVAQRPVEAVIPALKCLLKKKAILKFIHGDMHIENIAILADGNTLGFIDFGFSFLGKETAYQILDFIPLLGSIIPYFELFIIEILKFAKEMFHVRLGTQNFKHAKVGGYIFENHGITLSSYYKYFPYSKERPLPPIEILKEAFGPEFKAPRIV
jgi:hypothetical protein